MDLFCLEGLGCAACDFTQGFCCRFCSAYKDKEGYSVPRSEELGKESHCSSELETGPPSLGVEAPFVGEANDRPFSNEHILQHESSLFKTVL